LDPFARLLDALHQAEVRFVVIGVAGANYHAVAHQTLFATQDRDLLLPLEPNNELACWRACLASDLELTSAGGPLESPIDLELAERVVANRATVRGESSSGLQVDLNLVMAGFDFEEVWRARSTFLVEGVEIPVATLEHIVESKRTAGRDKDLLFLRQHRDVLEEILRRPRAH
jgi:hypothetical protein